LSLRGLGTTFFDFSPFLDKRTAGTTTPAGAVLKETSTKVVGLSNLATVVDGVAREAAVEEAAGSAVAVTHLLGSLAGNAARAEACLQADGNIVETVKCTMFPFRHLGFCKEGRGWLCFGCDSTTDWVLIFGKAFDKTRDSQNTE